jgi:hypothetical protein
MAQLCCPTTRQVIVEAERTNARLGHDNLGSLSTSRGFIPLQPPRLSFASSHAAWDEVTAQLPALYRDLAVRAALDAMPVLPADPAALPDADLQRAATVLGVLGHAWVHGTPDGRTDLPDSVARPWAAVRRRLGRSPEPVLSYVDLIVHNWRLADDVATAPLRLPNLRLLVPAVGNQEEQVFYLSQLEILAGCASTLPLVADAQDAVLADEPQALRAALDGIADVLRTTRRSLSSIDPRPHSATHVDPVV